MSAFKLLHFLNHHPLARKRKVAAICRFLLWQIRCRLTTAPMILSWVNGARLFVNRGETGLTGNIYTGLHEFEEMGYLLHVLRSEDTFVDVGANMGSYTILAASAVGASVVSFEPIPAAFERLVENVECSGAAAWVSCRNLGVAESEGELRFSSALDTVNHVLGQQEVQTEAVKVKVTTLDDALSDESPSVVKIDVEGYEAAVIKGAEATLGNESLHSVIVELNGSGAHYGFDEEEVLEKMQGHGFAPFAYDPFSRKLSSLEGKNEKSGNTIFIRNVDLVEERLQSAETFRVFRREI